MKYESVVIRTREQLDNIMNPMLSSVLRNMAKIGDWNHKEYPIVYQFAKGKDGETVGFDNDDAIGTASNLRIDEGGNFVADIVIMDVKGKSCNFNGTIDNMVVAQTEITKGEYKFELYHFVVYDKMVREDMEKSSALSGTVRKMYNAPTPAYTGNPSAGGKITKIRKNGDVMLEEMGNISPTNIHLVNQSIETKGEEE